MKRIEFPQSRVRAGVARADITPPVGIYHRMWGAATHDRSTGIHRPLTATALFLAPQNGADHSAKCIIAVDHCLLWHTEMQMILSRISEIANLPEHQVLVCFSHTHAAGLIGLERRELPGGELIPAYLELLGETLGTIASQARARQQAATIMYAVGNCELATNRDYWDEARRQFVCGFNPGGAADTHVLVARVVSDRQQLLATMVNYACHPTTLAWENTLISPDYPGAMREVVEQATGVPCVFLQGAAGDIGPREGFVGDPNVADRHGRQLGYAALAALEGLSAAGQSYVYSGPLVSGATLGIWRHEPLSSEREQQISIWQEAMTTISLKYRDDLADRESLEREQAFWDSERQAALAAVDEQRARDAHAMIERCTRRLVRCRQLPPGPAFPFAAPVWRMGDAIWIGLNGEHYNVLQRELRTAFPENPLVIATLVNGSQVWYLPDESSYGKGLYEEEASVLAAGSLERLINALRGTIEKLSTVQ